jgi:hypothetical protein
LQWHDDDLVAVGVERVHDDRLVRTPQAQARADADHDPDQLGHRVFRVLPAGAGQRIGSNDGFSAAQLKTVQEVITLGVFSVFSVLYLNEPLRWNVLAGFALIALGAALVYKPW